jgi:hypothetical protein
MRARNLAIAFVFAALFAVGCSIEPPPVTVTIDEPKFSGEIPALLMLEVIDTPQIFVVAAGDFVRVSGTYLDGESIDAVVPAADLMALVASAASGR